MLIVLLFMSCFVMQASQESSHADLACEHAYDSISCPDHTDEEALQSVQKYLDNGGDVNKLVTGYPYFTLLFATVIDGPKPKTMEFLLQKGANPNVMDLGGLSPLHHAIRCLEHKKYESAALVCIKSLLDHNAQPNIRQPRELSFGFGKKIMENAVIPRPLDLMMRNRSVSYDPTRQLYELFLATGKPLETIEYPVYQELHELYYAKRRPVVHDVLYNQIRMPQELVTIMIHYDVQPPLPKREPECIEGVNNYHVYTVP